jgi:hypothetical protein
MLPTWFEDAVAGQQNRSDKNRNEQAAPQESVEPALLDAVHACSSMKNVCTAASICRGMAITANLSGYDFCAGR